MLREEFYKSTIGRIAAETDLDEETLEKIKMIMISQMDNYSIEKRCTEVAVINGSNETAIKMFLASMLTENRSRKTITVYKNSLTMLIKTSMRLAHLM